MCPCLQVLGQIFMRSKMVTSILACMVCVYSSLKKKNFKKSIVYLFIITIFSIINSIATIMEMEI